MIRLRLDSFERVREVTFEFGAHSTGSRPGQRWALQELYIVVANEGQL